MALRSASPIVEIRPVGNSEIMVWARDEDGQWWHYAKGIEGRVRSRSEERPCDVCGTVFLRRSAQGQHGKGLYCSTTCSNRSFKPKRHRKGSDHPNWRGGRFINKRDGYVWVHTEDGWRLEHRVLMAKHLNRSLFDYETVHHKNGDKADNRIKNLELHVGRHGRGATEAHCPTCSCFEGMING